jgi:hypothetical protein
MRLSRSVVAAACLAGLVGACGSIVITPSPAASPASATPTLVPATAPPPTPVGSSVDAPLCGPPDVAVEVTGEGATGSILLVIRATNRGTGACFVDGPPTSIGLRSGGGSLPVTYQAHVDPWPGTSPDLVAGPVLLPPNRTAMARAVWSNWCLGPADVSTVWVGLGPESVDTYPDPAIPPPRCDNENAESTLAGFPFEADTSGG